MRNVNTAERARWEGPRTAEDLAGYEWASSIVADEFRRGLSQWTSEEFIRERWLEFCLRNDPVHVRIVSGLGDEALRRQFVTFWTLGQTIASQSRFWLELAILRILLHQSTYGPRPMELYAPGLQDESSLLRLPLSLADFGDERREGLFKSQPWSVNIQSSCLERIDYLVGQQERVRQEGLRFRRDSVPVDELELDRARIRDGQHLEVIGASLGGPPLEAVHVRCSLIVVEPDRRDNKPHAWAIRLVNPKLLARPSERKDERTNVLRLVAYVLQEKALRPVGGVASCVAEVVPRRTPARNEKYADYFSDLTYWPSWRFWKFVGVPFAAIEAGIERAASEAGVGMQANLRAALKKHEASVNEEE